MGEKNVHASVSACLLVLVPVVVSVAFSLSLSLPLSLFLSPSLPLSPCAVCVCVCQDGGQVLSQRSAAGQRCQVKNASIRSTHYTRVVKYNQPRRDLLQHALREVRSDGGGGCFLNKRLPKKPNLKECQYKLARSQATAVPARSVLAQRFTLTRGHHACVR